MVVQNTDYYPFGLQHSTSWTRITDLKNSFLYNAGSELNDKTKNYETYYRQYDPAIGRFTGIDPYAASFSNWSPYNYAFNDPVKLNDPMGDFPRHRTSVIDAVRQFGVESWNPDYICATCDGGGGMSGNIGSGMSYSGGFGGNAYAQYQQNVYEAQLLYQARTGNTQALNEYAVQHGQAPDADDRKHFASAFGGDLSEDGIWRRWAGVTGAREKNGVIEITGTLELVEFNVLLNTIFNKPKTSTKKSIAGMSGEFYAKYWNYNGGIMNGGGIEIKQGFGFALMTSDASMPTRETLGDKVNNYEYLEDFNMSYDPRKGTMSMRPADIYENFKKVSEFAMGFFGSSLFNDQNNALYRTGDTLYIPGGFGRYKFDNAIPKNDTIYHRDGYPEWPPRK